MRMYAKGERKINYALVQLSMDSTDRSLIPKIVCTQIIKYIFINNKYSQCISRNNWVISPLMNQNYFNYNDHQHNLKTLTTKMIHKQLENNHKLNTHYTIIQQYR